MVFHALNRANNRDEVFEDEEDYLAFLRVMRDDGGAGSRSVKAILHRMPVRGTECVAGESGGAGG